MNEEAVQRVLGTMVAAKLYGHDLRLRALGRKEYRGARVKLWCVRCYRSHEFVCDAGANGEHTHWGSACSTKSG